MTNERLVELAVSAAIALGGTAVSIGIASPGKRLDDHEARLRVLEARGERIEQKVDDVLSLLRRR